MDELQEALVIKIGVPSLGHDLITEPSKLVRACGSLINHDEISDFVTFSHETVRGFLEKHKLEKLPSHSEICRTCLEYLRLVPLRDFLLYQERETMERDLFAMEFLEIGEGPDLKLCPYAIDYWATHARLSKPSLGLETSILQTFALDIQKWAAIDEFHFRDRQFNRSRMLLEAIIAERLTFIFTPLWSTESFQSEYDLSLF
jgi:hypothetical protein